MPSVHHRSLLWETSSGRTGISGLPLSSSLSAGHMKGKHVVRKRREPKEKRNNVGERSRPRHPPDTPTIAVLWLKSSLLINHTYNKQTSSDKTRTHTHTNKLHMTGLSFLLQTQSVKCQTSITAPLLSAMKHAHRFIVYIYLSKKKTSFSTPFYKKDWRSHVCVFFKHFIKTGKSSLLSRGISFYFRYLVKQVSFLHQLLKEDDEDVRL